MAGVDVIVGGSGAPDLHAVDVVARIALAVRSGGGRIAIVTIEPAFDALLTLAGLRVEMERKTEGGEEALLVDEGEEEAH